MKYPCSILSDELVSKGDSTRDFLSKELKYQPNLQLQLYSLKQVVGKCFDEATALAASTTAVQGAKNVNSEPKKYEFSRFDLGQKALDFSAESDEFELGGLSEISEETGLTSAADLGKSSLLCRN